MQILNVVKATFPAHTFPEDSSVGLCTGQPDSDIAKLECHWQKAMSLARQAAADSAYLSDAELSLIAFARGAQDLMSSAASNYNVPRLNQGIAVAALSVILSGILCWFGPLRRSGCTSFFALIAVGYTVLMFASSYVEEEQQYWYWMLAGWQIYLYTRSYVSFPSVP